MTEEHCMNCAEWQRQSREIDRLRAENEQLRIDKITLGNFGTLPAYRSQEAEIDRLRAELAAAHKFMDRDADDYAAQAEELDILRAENVHLIGIIKSHQPFEDNNRLRAENEELLKALKDGASLMRVQPPECTVKQWFLALDRINAAIAKADRTGVTTE
jgi:hypothetical protein